MTTSNILIIGQEKLYIKALGDTLKAYDHQTSIFSDPGSALNALENQTYDLVISEENMTPISGRDILQTIQTKTPDLPVILFTEFGTVERAVQAMREGAVDYLVKPIDTDFLLELVDRYAPNRNDVTRSNDDMVARDPFSLELLQIARKVAAKEVSVLISGESGTGKEVVARYIHTHSPRVDHPFVAINCAAIPENMLEAVLFGHEKGSFTGAVQANPGKFELAQGGTLLLDEISEMDVGLQAKLLRVLQEKEVERLGSQTTTSLDVRVLATTNKNLSEEVKNGAFREDLYYRLNVFPLRLTPLRERPGDIIPLAEQLTKRHTPIGQRVPAFTPSAIALLESNPWPGNVRELSNVIQRALVLCDGFLIQEKDLHVEIGIHHPTVSPHHTEVETGLNRDLKTHEYDLILRALQAGRGSRKYAAEQLGISPRTLRYKLAKMRDQGLAIPAA